jgi:predicted O-methyltransferase YrrM
MGIRNLLGNIPFIVQAHTRIVSPIRRRLTERRLKRLEYSQYPQGAKISEALVGLQHEPPLSGKIWVERIELERMRLLSRHEALDDGSLGQGGLYDDGVTIEQACSVSKPPKPALLLFLLTRTIEPMNVIELGTNVGISSAYIGAGLKANGQGGRIATLDASPYRQRLAREMHRNLGIDNTSYIQGLFTDTLDQTLATPGPVDLAFIDGHHQYQPTLDYFEKIYTSSAPGAVFVFDDIRWSDGMKRAWSRIRSDDRLGLVVDLHSVGICVRRQDNISRRFVFDLFYVF